MAFVNGQVAAAASGPGLLVGRFDHALDPKKRLTVPAGWRDLMGSPAYVYVFPDPNETCLNLIPPAEMEGRLEKLRQRALFDKRAGEALRVFGENAEQAVLDVQGRIRIRDRLLAFAGLSDKVVLIGALNRVQLWSPILWPETETVDQAALAAACETLDF
jgi:MraZ protein